MQPTSPTRRILVVDDNPSIHKDFHKILARNRSKTEDRLTSLEQELFGVETSSPTPTEFEMDSAFQGEEALRKVVTAQAEGRPYSLAFVDVRMPPGWDGIETTARLWKETPELQVVICTAYSDYSWEEILAKLGESDSVVILKKPFDNAEVLQLAHALTKKWTLARRARSQLADLDAEVRLRTQELISANQTLRDEISRRTEVENALRETEERFRKAFGAAAVALTILQAGDQCIIDANQAFGQISGHELEELKGSSPQALRLFARPEAWEELVQRLRAGEKSANQEIIVQRKDGTARQAILSVEPILLAQLPHYLVVMVDITEQRQLESRVRQAYKMEAIGQLAAGIAHDFNNLLTVIHGHASLHLRRGDLDPALGKSLEQVKLASERATDLTRQLLAFSRKQNVHFETLDINTLVWRMRSQIQKALGADITLQFQPIPGLPPINADLSNLEQIVLNLVENARDAMPKGGRLTINTRSREMTSFPDRQPEHPPGTYVELALSDTGVGMDSHTLERLFEPFFTTKPAGKSTGLGLATVYGIVRQHQGWIEVESAPGQGATFRILFPARERKPAAQPATIPLALSRPSLP